MNIWPLLFLFLAIAPALVVWLRERRLNRVAKAELALARTVTQMETHLLQGAPTNGDVSHDILFMVMQHIQYQRDYSLPFSLKVRPEAVQFRKELEQELAQEGCPFAGAVNSFYGAFYEVFKNKHPWQHKLYFVSIFYRYLSNRKASRLIKRLNDITAMWTAFADSLRRQVFVEAGAHELEVSRKKQSQEAVNGLTYAI